MSTTYSSLGTALYNIFNTLDITSIYPGGWAEVANYPLKEPGNLTTWPVCAIYPAQDNEVALENVSDDNTVTYFVDLFASFESSATTEGKMRQLVDLCRTRLRQERADETPLENAAYTLDQMNGEWGFDLQAGLRFYRFTIQTKTYETLL